MKLWDLKIIGIRLMLVFDFAKIGLKHTELLDLTLLSDDL
jgi:hypothetical protein